MKIWVLAISHRHGTNLYANATEAGSDKARINYIKENWADRNDDMTPDDPTGMSDEVMTIVYFENHPSEFYEQEHVEQGD